jgi:hypothetical protein
MNKKPIHDASNSVYRTDSGKCFTSDLVLWKENDILSISPKFQRRAVWQPAAKSFFIDTILRGMTVPPFYFRLTQNPEKTKAIREVVDGQQRVRSVLEFIADEYRLSESLVGPWAAKRFSQLSPDEQQRIMVFRFPSETFQGISDKQILEVFCRLNMNGVGLNKQELRNGRWFGKFKDRSYGLAYEYLEFWRKHKIFTEQGIARMLEVEMTSELLIAQNKGMQDKKGSIDDFYRDWENSYPTIAKDSTRFREVMDTLAQTFTDDQLSSSAFRRPPLFYTLYCVVYHHVYGLSGIQRVSPRKKLITAERDSLIEAVGELSEVLADTKDPTITPPKKFSAFILACQRQTDNIQPRKTRFDALYDTAF